MNPHIVLMSAFRGQKSATGPEPTGPPRSWFNCSAADDSSYIVWAVSGHRHRLPFATPRPLLQG
jgi:hypothetical protein